MCVLVKPVIGSGTYSFRLGLGSGDARCGFEQRACLISSTCLHCDVRQAAEAELQRHPPHR
jgi:hypothetical protein